MAESPLQISPEALAAAEAAAKRAGLSPREWLERLVMRDAAPREVGPEDEVRGGPEAVEKPASPTDD